MKSAASKPNLPSRSLLHVGHFAGLRPKKVKPADPASAPPPAANTKPKSARPARQKRRKRAALSFAHLNQVAPASPSHNAERALSDPGASADWGLVMRVVQGTAPGMTITRSKHADHWDRAMTRAVSR